MFQKKTSWIALLVRQLCVEVEEGRGREGGFEGGGGRGGEGRRRG